MRALLAGLVVFLGACATQQRPRDIPRDVEELVGSEGLDLIDGAETVLAYRVDGTGRAETASSFEGLPVLAMADVDAAARETLARVLRAETSYLFDIAGKGCMPVPGVGLRWSEDARWEGKALVDDDRLAVLLCFECNMVRFMHGAHDRWGHFDPARAELVAIVKRLFPDDPAIQALRDGR